MKPSIEDFLNTSNDNPIPQLQKLEVETNNYIQELRSGSNNILVAVRNRPLTAREEAQSNFETIRILNSKVVVLLDPANEFEPEDVFRKNRNKETQFAFDFAFDKYVDNQEVYRQSCGFLIDGVLEGYNATVFAFGPTGAGKTYTMVGGTENTGVMLQATNELFSKIALSQELKEYILKVSYLEIYNEVLHDLLTIDDKPLDIREDPNNGITITGITEIATTSQEQVMTMIKIGNKNRIKESTGANEASSRSHAILSIIVEHKERNQGVQEEIKLAKLALVDLAGSERAANTNNRGIRMFEGGKINQSLLELGNCIQALAESNEKKKSQQFINFRGSKLTRILKDSLSGNCRTVMIANISPAITAFEDTYNTLNYANRAKNIKTNVKRNVLNVDNHIANYEEVIKGLKNENEQLKVALQSLKNSSPSIHPKQLQMNNNNPNQQIVEKLENQIKSHFDDELDLKQKFHQVDYEIESLNFNVFSKISELNNNEIPKNEVQKQKEKIESLKTQIITMTRSRDDLIQQHQELSKERTMLLTTVKQNSQLNEMHQSYLITLIKQNSLIIENSDFEFKEKKQENQEKIKELQIIFLTKQLNLRDNIIDDQKKIMDDHKIKGQALKEFEQLKTSEEIQEQAKLILPQINLKQAFIPNKKVYGQFNSVNIQDRNAQRLLDNSRTQNKQLKLPQLSKRQVELNRSTEQQSYLKQKQQARYWGAHRDSSIVGKNEQQNINPNPHLKYPRRPQKKKFGYAAQGSNENVQADQFQNYKYGMKRYQSNKKLNLSQRKKLNNSVNSQELNASVNQGRMQNLNLSTISTASSGQKKQIKAQQQLLQEAESRNNQKNLYSKRRQQHKNLLESPYVINFQKKEEDNEAKKLRLQQMQNDLQNKYFQKQYRQKFQFDQQ